MCDLVTGLKGSLVRGSGGVCVSSIESNAGILDEVM
jgi:hypothetical protein